MYYFAYASNLNRKQMRARCPGSKPLFKATLPNYQLVFSGWSRVRRGGTANIRLNQGQKVLGAVYDVSEQEMKKLDLHEAGYDRLKVNVFDEDGEPREVITYIKAGQAEDAKPSADYLSIIQQGYKDWRLT
ncbi:MAG: gamma-glutamylcyclotransferase family protein [Dehalococcoidales bacterium]